MKCIQNTSAESRTMLMHLHAPAKLQPSIQTILQGLQTISMSSLKFPVKYVTLCMKRLIIVDKCFRKHQTASERLVCSWATATGHIMVWPTSDQLLGCDYQNWNEVPSPCSKVSFPLLPKCVCRTVLWFECLQKNNAQLTCWFWLEAQTFQDFRSSRMVQALSTLNS